MKYFNVIVSIRVNPIIHALGGFCMIWWWSRWCVAQRRRRWPICLRSSWKREWTWKIFWSCFFPTNVLLLKVSSFSFRHEDGWWVAWRKWWSIVYWSCQNSIVEKNYTATTFRLTSRYTSPKWRGGWKVFGVSHLLINYSYRYLLLLLAIVVILSTFYIIKKTIHCDPNTICGIALIVWLNLCVFLLEFYVLSGLSNMVFIT